MTGSSPGPAALMMAIALLLSACGADSNTADGSGSEESAPAASSDDAANEIGDEETGGNDETGESESGDGQADDDHATSTQADNAGDVIDITNSVLTKSSANCADYAATYVSDATDVASGTVLMGSLTVEVGDRSCTFRSNAIPNHDLNDAGGFVNGVSEQSLELTIPANPQPEAEPTPLSLRYDNAVMLNGVKVDLLAAGCYGVGDGFIGCFELDTPYRYDPMSPLNEFGTDSHNAHTQPGGEYHYHGNPKALFDDGDDSVPSPVIGFAADGFPIFGSYFDDGGTIRKAESSYQLKEGSRNGGPGGAYDGQFIDDYEFVDGSGDLDQCNGMNTDGVYGYYVTDSYPHILGCFNGTPDASFQKTGPGR